MRIVNYLNKNGEPRTVEFSQIIKQWIEYNGGVNQVTKALNRMSETEKSIIHVNIIQFFVQKYNCTLPGKDSSLAQPEFFNPDIYHQAIFNAQYEYNTRPTSGYNIVLIIILALAVFGLVKMCS